MNCKHEWKLVSLGKSERVRNHTKMTVKCKLCADIFITNVDLTDLTSRQALKWAKEQVQRMNGVSLV